MLSQTPTAQAIEPQSTPPVEWVLFPGQPLKLRFIDGREITLKRSILKPENITSPFVIFENTCSVNGIGQSGIHHLQLLGARVQAVWSAHPQKERLGQTVQRKRNGTFSPVDLVDFIPPDLIFKMPEMQGVATAESLEMDDFSWIPGNSSKEAPLEAQFLRWEGEQTRINRETLVAENRPIKGYSDVTMSRSSARRLTVNTIRHQASADGTYGYPYGDVVTIVMASQIGKLCQISYRSDLTMRAQAVLRARTRLQKVDEDLKYGEDSLIALWQFANPVFADFFSPEGFYVTQVEETPDGKRLSYGIGELQ